MNDTTTIQITSDVQGMLKQLQEEKQFSSYNEVLKSVLKKTLQKKSLAGFLGKRLSREEILKDLRDENE